MMRVLSWSIDSPVLDSDVVDHAKAAAREEALEFTDARMQTLVSCARTVETYVGRALWPGTRAALSIVEVNDPYETVSLVPGLPNTAGVTLGVPAIREWSDTLGDWQAVTVTRRPAGMVRLPRSGEFEIAVSRSRLRRPFHQKRSRRWRGCGPTGTCSSLAISRK